MMGPKELLFHFVQLINVINQGRLSSQSQLGGCPIIGEIRGQRQTGD